MPANRNFKALGIDGLSRLYTAKPIIAKRAPTTNDSGILGQPWIDTQNQAAYQLVSASGSSFVWASAPAAGATTVTSLTVTTGNVDVQAGGSTTTISSGTINFDNAGGTTTISGDLVVSGDTTLNGDFDISSSAALSFTSTADVANAILFDANGGTSSQIRLLNQTGTGADSIEAESTNGGVTLTSTGLVANNAIDVNANAGGVTMDAATAISLDAGAGSNFSVSGAGNDLNLESAGGRVVLNGEEAADDAIRLLSVAGGLDADLGLGISLISSESAADAIVLEASDGAGGVQVRAGSNGILIGNQADCAVIDIGDVVATSARTITIGGGSVATAIADTIDIAPDGATTDAGASKVLNLNAGALDTATLTTNIASGNVSSGTHAVNVSTGTGTKTINLGNADGLTTMNFDGVLNLNDSQNSNTQINSGSSTGTVTIGNTSSGAVTIDSAADISLTGTGSSINLVATEAAADAIVVNASNGAGGIDLTTGGGSIDLSSGGSVSMVPGTDTSASPSATATVNKRVFKATFTGFTTASAGTQDFTISNSTHTAGAAVILSVANAGTNDAKMNIQRINVETAGSIVVSTVNDGAAALNGDVIISGWCLD